MMPIPSAADFRPRRFFLTFAALSACVGAAATTLVRAQVVSGDVVRIDGFDPDGAYAGEIASGRSYLSRGRREAARSKFEEVLEGMEEEDEEDRPTPAERSLATLGLARIEREFGNYDEAAKRLAAARAFGVRALTPSIDLAKAKLARTVGKFDEAAKALRRALEASPRGSLRWFEASFRGAQLSALRGAREDAAKVYGEIEAAGKREPLREPLQKFWYAKALVELGGAQRLYEASQIFIEVSKALPRFAPAYLARGNLLYEVYRETAGQPSGESEYKRAIQNCGEQEDVLVALYRSRKDNYILERAKTEGFLTRALTLNSKSVPALVQRASSMIDDRRFGAARSILRKALGINPRDVEALAEMVVASKLLYREKDERDFRGRLLAVDPQSVLAEARMGAHLVALYRFADAIPVLQKVRQARPDYVPALLSLGRALLYAGRADEGAAVLEETKKIQAGFVNPWRKNQLLLQRRVDETYRRVSIGNFEFKVHPSEIDVLVPYLSREYERARKKLGTKYGVFPDCKVQVENFRRFGDFSVRTVGFTGFGALGACFGCFITSVSPVAPELRSKFSWKVTAWHEFAHVLHLQLSKARVPRWLTEGASVYEEIALDPSLDRRMEREVYSALVTDRVIGVRDLNRVFGGSQILLGYYQGGLICRHIARDWGFEKVVEIIRLYGEDKTADEVFETALGLSPDAYDKRFRGYLKDLLGNYTLVPTIDDAALESYSRRVLEKPKDKLARLRLAQGLEQRGNTVDAGQQLAALRTLDPNNGDALLLRAKMQLRRAPERARKLLSDGFAQGGEDFDSRMSYAQILERAGREKDALEQYALAIACWPTCSVSGNASPFVARARIFRKMGKREEAIDELSRYVSIVGKDYNAQKELAEHWKKEGQVARELRCRERMRDIDPFDRPLHERLAEIYAARGRHDEAAFCLKIAIAVPAEKDRAGAARLVQGKVDEDKERAAAARLRVLRAESLRDAGRSREAKEVAARALRDEASLSSALAERARAIAADK